MDVLLRLAEFNESAKFGLLSHAAMQFTYLARFAIYRGDESYDRLKWSIKSYKCSRRAYMTIGKEMAPLFMAVKTGTASIRESSRNQAQEDADKRT